MKLPALSLIALIALPGIGQAMGPTERACLSSPRSPGQQVCSCAQQVADQTLNAADQRQAARIISEPDLYLEFKYSSNGGDKAFLERYKRWGEYSAQVCRG